MTYSEWENTAWAGTPTPKSTLPSLVAKGITGAGAVSMQVDIPLTMVNQTPQQKFARYLRCYRYGWFYKAESRIARDFGALAWSLQKNDTTIEETGDLSPEQRVLKLLSKPNPKQTRSQLAQKQQIRVDMTGNAIFYWDTPDEFGIPSAIWGISPARMTPSFDKAGNLIGWVMDADGRGGGVPFTVDEIGHLAYASPDDDLWGVGVVEAVYAEASVSELITRHTADLLSTGGRLAGMISPKQRQLNEDEFQDVVKAWRNVASDPNAARRLLVFPEPMEWTAGAADPKDLQLLDLAGLNRESILSAFPIDYAMLGGPLPAGLSNGGEARREIKANYWEGTLHPRVEAFEEFFQESLVARLEAATGEEYDFEIEEPDLDDAESLLDKVAAFKALAGAGFDADEAVAVVGLDHIKFNGVPPAPSDTQVAVQETQRAGIAYTVNQPLTPVAKARLAKQREEVVEPATTGGKHQLSDFFRRQQARIITNVTNLWPKAKAARVKGVPDDWWVAATEDTELSVALSYLYREVARGGLQVVADRLGRFVYKNQYLPIADDILRSGGTRITEINETTRKAITDLLSEGSRRGYSIPQIVDGVPDESFTGLKNLPLSNGIGAWDEYRAEMIARTETATAYNQAALGGYKALGVDRVHVYDGDGDDICAPWDGWEGPLSEAPDYTGHPNCTRDFAPIVGGEKSVSDIDKFIDFATKAIEASAATKQAPMSFVLPSEVTIPPQPTPIINVQVPAQAAPVVHVEVPTQPAPIVNIETKAPIVETKAPIVNVSMPEIQDVRIVASTLPPKKRTVTRNRAGQITEITEQ